MLLSHDEIAHLVPHAGAMCLLDGVVAWDPRSIDCETARHADVRNPLAADGRLSPLAGIEFAAQAMALHAALLDSRSPCASTGSTGAARAHGVLVRVRDCAIRCARLDRAPIPLRVRAERLAASSAALSYRFALAAGDGVLLDGTAMIALAGTGQRASRLEA
jgi:predicted hotdog family 3-hydroxylacyl-ACP dehydratase